MKAREWVAAFLIPRFELVRELDKAKRVNKSLLASAEERRERIRALEVDNARLKAELQRVRDERDEAWVDVDSLMIEGKLPDRPRRVA